MESKIYAPVSIPTLNRYEHFKRCLESIERCTGADKTEVFVGLDYPPSDKYKSGWEKIDAYLREKEQDHKFGNLIVYRRDHNFGITGPLSNAKAIQNEIRKKYDCYILSEDDNEFSPNFLEFMNWGLTTFENDPRINAICGFNELPVEDITDDNIFMARRYNAWGVGRWFKKWDALLEMVHQPNFYKEKIKEYPISTIFGGDIHRASCIIGVIEGGIIHGDGITYLKPKDEQFSVFPVISMVRNYGHDGLGVHGGSKKQSIHYTGMKIDTNTSFVPITENPNENTQIEVRLKKFFVLPFKVRLYETMNFLAFKLFGRGLSSLLLFYKKYF